MTEILDDNFVLPESQPQKTSKLVLLSRIFIIAFLGFNIFLFIIRSLALLTSSNDTYNDISTMFLIGGVLSFIINLFVIIYNSKRLQHEWKQTKAIKSYTVSNVLFIIYCIFQIIILSLNLFRYLSYFSLSIDFIKIAILLFSLIVVIRKEIQYFSTR